MRFASHLFSLISALAAAGLPSLLTAQAPGAVMRAAETITPNDVARRIGIIADDSMMGRDTPSRGLELTAQYVADQFKKFGLKPGGENGTYFQRYAITRKRLDMAGSHINFTIGKAHTQAQFTRDAALSFGGAPAKPVAGRPILISGALDAQGIAGAGLRDRIAMVVLDYSKPRSASVNEALGAMLQAGIKAMVIVSNRDSATFAQRVAQQGTPQTSVGSVAANLVPVVEIHERALGQVLRPAGLDVVQLRQSATMVTKPLANLTVELNLKTEILDSATAPNTIGILEGSDPQLKNEYLVYSAHMDHIGISAGRPDSINNGADDDASGTAGVVELAEAFSQTGARPKRSVLFLTVSGEEKGLWGSAYFTDRPTVPTDAMVADLNIDMIGRNWKDTIVAIGKEHSDLGSTLNRVNAAHPELKMTAIDDKWPDESFYTRSDHFNFARKGVPILFFFNGVHADYHQVSDEPAKIDSEKESRILQLLFHLGQELANAPARPKWNPESYKEIVHEQ